MINIISRISGRVLSRIILVTFLLVSGVSVLSAQQSKEDPSKELRYIEALRLLNLGHPDEAETIFLSLVKQFPEMDAAHF